MAATSHEDRLVAAVNDQMDPITLLVWCEESLTPRELSTLDRLLRSDDGTLAQDIGWNLLEIILPMLKEDPQQAAKCLDAIARRGNPREVIVKVAEVLEKLGEEDAQFSEGDEDSADELPTFPGEADRIHLGTLNIEGSSTGPDSRPLVDSIEIDHIATKRQAEAHNESLATVQFQSLMPMLGILHLRIKTQFPSRFLATSLPAALGAYRRIGVTAISTLAFLSFLGELSGRKPQLPARMQPTPVEASVTLVPEAPQRNSTVSMPDSEPEAEGSSMRQASQSERDIILKLLQAVLLEALDDYMASLQSREPSHMSWTTRLREQVEPGRLVPRKATELQKWHDARPLAERDKVLEEFLKIAQQLEVDVDKHFQNLLDQDGQLIALEAEGEDAESPSEYPTNPSQISFPPSGMLFLGAAQQFYSHQFAASEPRNVPSLVFMSRVYRFFRSEQNAAYLHASFATEDALLSLLYLIKDKPQLDNSSFDFQSFFMSLAAFCADFPDPQLRDAAHHIATALFHECPDVKTKLDLVIEILHHDTTPVNLKAVAVGWVKDEVARPSSPNLPSVVWPARIQDQDLEARAGILPLLFPERILPSTSGQEQGTYSVHELPYYISSLNLACVLGNHEEQRCPASASAMQAAVKGVRRWRSSHRDLEQISVQPHEQQDDEASRRALQAASSEYSIELFALDDAVARSSEAVLKPTITNVE